MKSFLIFICALIMLQTNFALAADIIIPRSMPDKGIYYLVEQSRSGDIVRALSKRVSSMKDGNGNYYIDYSLVEINCATMKMRGLGESENHPPVAGKATEWFDLVSGSSKSDLANFVCKNF